MQSPIALGTGCLLLDSVVLLSGNVQDVDGSTTEEQDTVGKDSDLPSQFDGGDKNQSSCRSGIGRVGREGLSRRTRKN